jgi:uncharacterized membrane protein (GlpM family)
MKYKCFQDTKTIVIIDLSQLQIYNPIRAFPLSKQMEYIFRFIAGGSLVVIVSLLGKIKIPFIPGIAVMFPAVTLVSYYFLLKDQDVSTVKNIIICSIYGVPSVAAFLVGLYWGIKHFEKDAALLIATVAWVFAAVLLFALDKYIFHFTK